MPRGRELTKMGIISIREISPCQKIASSFHLGVLVLRFCCFSILDDDSKIRRELRLPKEGVKIARYWPTRRQILRHRRRKEKSAEILAKRPWYPSSNTIYGADVI